MAKSITTQYRLQTERAVANVQKLTLTIKEYNQSVKATVKEQRLLNSQATALKANLRGINASAQKLVTTFKSSALEVRKAVREIKAFNKATDETKKKTRELSAQLKADRLVAKDHVRTELGKIDAANRLREKAASDELKRQLATDRVIARNHLRSQLQSLDTEAKLKEQSARADIQRAQRRDRQVAQAHFRAEIAKIAVQEKSASDEQKRQLASDRLIARNHLRSELQRIAQAARQKEKAAKDDIRRAQRLERQIAQVHLRTELSRVAAQERANSAELKRQFSKDRLVARAHVRSEAQRIAQAARLKEQEANNDLRRAARRDRQIAQSYLRTELQKLDAARRLQERQNAQFVRLAQRRDKQIAAAHLKAELERLGGRADKANDAIGRLHLTMFELRVAIGTLIARGIGQLIQGFSEAAGTARELSKRIAEVQTVSLEYKNGALESARAVADWRLEVFALSRNMGIPVLETTEALYNALSNQVVEAGNATNFMAQEMKLAITTVSTLDEAVNVTSTVINAFNKDVSETARINAILFKAVDVGRFRLSELGSQFGRVSVLSNELGISFEEQAGAIALLTRLGLEADVAQTLLTNVQLKLVKPTETMTELFTEWGVTSGQAAIQTFGFTGVIRKLAEQAQNSADPMSELGEIFQDLRAITGAQGLVSNFDKLEEAISDVTNSTEAFNKAFDLSLDAMGRKADIELEKLRQQMVTQFGEPFIRTLLAVAEFAGGADIAVSRLIRTISIVANVYLGYRTSLILTNSALALHSRFTTQATAATVANTAAVNANRAGLLAMSAAQAGATLGLTAIITLLGQMAVESQVAAAEFEASLSVLRSNLLEESRKALEKLQQKLGEVADSQVRFNNATFRAYFQFVANIRAQNNLLTEDFDKKFKLIKKSMLEGLDVDTDIITDRLRELSRAAETARDAVETLKKRGEEGRLAEFERRFEADLAEKNPKDAIDLIIATRNRFQDDALEALRRGDVDLADSLFTRADDLATRAQERISDLIKSTKEAALEIERTIDEGRVTEDTEIVDTKTILELEKQLKLIEDERRASVERRLALEREIIAEKEREAARLEEEIKTREAAFEVFKKFVAEIDSFDASGPDAAKRFDALIGGAEKAGGEAGLTGKEQLEFLRQAFAQRLLLSREAATAAARAQLDIEQKALNEGTKLVEEAIRKRQALLNSTSEQTEAFANRNIEIAERLRNEFDRGGLFQLGELQFGPQPGGLFAEGKVRTDKLKADILAGVEAFRQLNEQLLAARRNGTDTAPILAQIAAKQAELARLVDEVNKANVERQGGLINSNVGRNAEEEVLFQPVPGRPEESLSDLLDTSAESLTQLTAGFNEAAVAQRNLTEAMQLMARLKEQVALIPPEVRAQGEAAEEAAEVTVTAQQAVQRVLDGTLQRLEAIRREHERIIEMQRAEADALGTPIIPRAHGGPIPRAHGGFVGRGTDRHLVALSGGETIVNRLASRQYAPLLQAINRAPPQFRAQGGTVNNSYGDINIQPRSTVTNEFIMEVAQGLQRLERRGMFPSRGR